MCGQARARGELLRLHDAWQVQEAVLEAAKRGAEATAGRTERLLQAAQAIDPHRERQVMRRSRGQRNSARHRDALTVLARHP